MEVKPKFQSVQISKYTVPGWYQENLDSTRRGAQSALKF